MTGEPGELKGLGQVKKALLERGSLGGRRRGHDAGIISSETR